MNASFNYVCVHFLSQYLSSLRSSEECLNSSIESLAVEYINVFN